ncbi:MAG: ligase [Planctomycetota bacterium]
MSALYRTGILCAGAATRSCTLAVVLLAPAPPTVEPRVQDPTIRPVKAKQRIEELREEIRRHDHQYYNLGRPTISDASYDQLFAELRSLEAEHPGLVTPDSPTQRVGAPLAKGVTFGTHRHLAPMISIESIMTAEDVVEFDKRVRRQLELADDARLEWAVEPKLDGVSASLLYENGVLVRGLSRGDGEQGEDITVNLRTIRNLPLRLLGDGPFPSRIELRGEVIMQRTEFAKLQEASEETSETPFRNARNTVAGTLKLQDPRVVASRPMDFLCFAVGLVEGMRWDTHEAFREQVRAWGFHPAEPFAVVDHVQGLLDFRDDLERRRDDLPYELDGVVAKLNRVELQNRAGRTARTPRWALAYKFAPRIAMTRVESIGAQVGRTGAVTPVARLEPVPLAGVTVSNATLHNWDLLAERDVREGDWVEIQRAGDVIPEVVRVILEKRPADSEPKRPPRECPTCGTELEAEGAFRYCVNLECPDQLRGRVVHLCSRRALDIEGLGPKQVAQLIDAGILEKVEDVFVLPTRRDRVLQLERWGERSIAKIEQQVEKAKRPPLARFLHALGIRHVGEQTAKDLASHFGSLDRVREAGEEQLMEVDGVGEEVAGSVVRFFAQPRNRQFLQAMTDAGVEPVSEQPAGQGPLGGRIFVFTGGLQTMSRDEAKHRVEQLGARTAGSISKKVTDVVAGEAAGSKLEKARELGLTIHTEEQFVALLGK